MKYLNESRMTYHCFQALRSYSHQRSLKRQNKGMAYIKWRQAELLKCYKALKKYALKRKTKMVRFRSIMVKIQNAHALALKKQVFLQGLLGNVATQVAKKRKYSHMDAIRGRVLKKKVMAALNRNIALQRFVTG